PASAGGGRGQGSCRQRDVRRTPSRPGPGLAGTGILDGSSASNDSAARVRVAKREASYGPKSGPKAGSRASSPGEQAAACDYRKTRELGYKARELGRTRERGLFL